MDRIPFEQFERDAAEYDAAVNETPDIDHYCTSSDWILPAHLAFMPGRTSWIHRSALGFVAMVQGRHAHGWTFIEPLEAMWGLASPVVGGDVAGLGRELADLCAANEDEWDVILLAGMPQGSRLLAATLASMSKRYEILESGEAIRHVASLEDGFDGFLARRSRNFRRHARRAQQRALGNGIEFESCHLTDTAEADAVYQRILDVEERSWKGRAGVGINQGGMLEFYRLMIRRLAARSGHRTIFARHRDRDVGFVLGGVLGSTYRGLQMSYDAEYRAYSIGSLCQLEQIRQLCEEDAISEYDLGTGMEYKRRWAEDTVVAPVLLVVRRD